MKTEKNTKQSTSKKKNDKIEINENELNDNIKNWEKDIKNKNHLPKEEVKKINQKVFENMLIADFIIAFLFLISLGSLNIETAIFLIDLKVFSIAFSILTILLFEYSYRKENTNICIHGIECFFLAIFMLLSTYLYMVYFKDFKIIISIVSIMFAIYYVVKSIIIYIKHKKTYLSGLSDIDEIIKK